MKNSTNLVINVSGDSNESSFKTILSSGFLFLIRIVNHLRLQYSKIFVIQYIEQKYDIPICKSNHLVKIRDKKVHNIILIIDLKTVFTAANITSRR